MLYDPKWEKTETKPEVKALIRARALIEHPHNWARGNLVKCGGVTPTCAGISLDYSTNDVDTRTKATELFRNAIGGYSIILWNDAPERTHAEVLAAFDDAIASA